MKTVPKLFNRQIALPQDHGSWVFILSPLLIGLFAGKTFSPSSIYLIFAAMGVFFLRQPVTMAVKAYSNRRPRTDLPVARFWMVIYSGVILLALSKLIKAGYLYILYLAVPGIPVFIWHLWLVAKRTERRQPGVEILATGALSLVAPAAYWVGQNSYASLGWALWVLTWLQAAASIVYAYLRLGQRKMPVEREQAESVERSKLWFIGQRTLAYTSFNLALALILGWSTILSRWIFVPYLLQWAETLWGIFHPAIGWKPTAIGIRQLIVSTLFTVLFIICWRL